MIDAATLPGKNSTELNFQPIKEKPGMVSGLGVVLKTQVFSGCQRRRSSAAARDLVSIISMALRIADFDLKHSPQIR